MGLGVYDSMTGDKVLFHTVYMMVERRGKGESGAVEGTRKIIAPSFLVFFF